MRVSFADGRGSVIEGPVQIDRIPGSGEEIRLKGESYIIQSDPIRNEPVTILGSTSYVAVLTVAAKGKGKKKSESVLVRE